MLEKTETYLKLLKQFGLRYSYFRIRYEISKKLGLFKLKFPQKKLNHTYIDLRTWKNKDYQSRFFLSDYNSFPVTTLGNSETTKKYAQRVLNGEVLFFFNQWKTIPQQEWNVHPVSKYKYKMQHWSTLPIYSKTAGDIKYVWEKSKFSYLLYIARNDYKFKEDHSQFVFDEIISWIDHNPPNTGPQYICSQEISIRLMNWSLLLFFYAKSESLTNEKWQKILNSIRIQIEHVYKNINFSRIAVRNNHAVTECLALYLIPTFFPFLNKALKFKKKGLQWFEEEIEYQLYADGSDNQFSFTYHRVKVQLLSWYLATAKANNEDIPQVIEQRAKATLQFLFNMMANHQKGYLPNFGANDGSIYFKLNDCDYRDFRPQLIALADLLGVELQGLELSKDIKEDAFYFTEALTKRNHIISLNSQQGISDYENGGYVLINEDNVQTVFKTPEYKDRISQDDYFHLDIWVNGENFMMDTGSYLYNTTPKTFNYFNGVQGHNTASVSGFNHLKKGPSFIWLMKPKHIKTTTKENDSFYEVCSHMRVFYPYLHELKRTIQKSKKTKLWTITDEVFQKKKHDELIQNWNYNSDFEKKFSIINPSNPEISSETNTGFFSHYYGAKRELNNIVMTTTSTKIITQIKIKS